VPFEGVVCTECGAVQGITQVETDTFYCSHHKGLFKYSDSYRFKVEIEGDFCRCGDRVEFRCQPCGQALCVECDVIEWQKRSRTSSRHPLTATSMYPRKLVVPITDFGYIELDVGTLGGNKGGYPASYRQSEKEHREQAALFNDGPAKDGIVIGGGIDAGSASGLRPLLYADDIIPILAKGRAGGLRHLCCSCLAAGAPATIDAIVQGRICEHPCCGAPPTVKCGCCGSAFCSRHTWNSPARGTWRTAAQFSFWGGQKIINSPPMKDLCRMCAIERMQSVREEAVRICDMQRRITREYPFNPEFPVYRVVEPLRSLILPTDDTRMLRVRGVAEARARNVGGAIDAWARELDRNPVPCAKGRPFGVPPRILGPHDLIGHIVLYKVIPRKV